MSIALERKIGLVENLPFTIMIGDKEIDLQLDEAEELYLQLKRKFGKAFTKKDIIDNIVKKSTKLGYVEYGDTFIPVGYKFYTIISSEPKNGKPIHYYHYFKDSKGNFGFLIKNGITKPFAKLGNILDPTSTIGKIIRSVPKNIPIKKSYFVNNKLAMNNQRVKAMIDILVTEGFLKKIQNTNSKITSYRITKKGLEFVDNIEPIKVQSLQSHKLGS